MGTVKRKAVPQNVKTPKAQVEPDDGAIDAALELGISGTTNRSGEPMSESNARLRGTSGYGTAGTYSWGEWEQLKNTDPDIATVLEFVASPIRDASISVEPEDEEDASELEVAQAEFVERQIRNASPGWSEFSTQVVKNALSHGFALHEPVFKVGRDESLPDGGGYLLSALAERLPVSVHPTNGWIESTESGTRELAYVRQQGQTNDGGYSTTVDVPANRLLLHSWQRSGLNYRGMSAFRAVWYIAKIRAELLKLIGIASVREGAGIPVAQSDGAEADVLTPSQQRKLARALQNLVGHEHASMVMPRGWSIEWIFSPAANKGHIVDTYNALGQLILRQLGAQQISLGTGETGSRSVGEVHDAVADQYIHSVVQMMQDVLNGQSGRPYTGLVRKIIDVNWGPQARYPKLKITLRQRKLPAMQRIQAIATARQAGTLTNTPDVENSVREALGLEAISEEDIAEAKAAAREKMQPADESQPEPKEKMRRTCSCATHRLARLAWSAPFRPLTECEKRVDFARIDNAITSAREAFEAAAKPIVRKMIEDARGDVAAALADGDPSELETLALNSDALERMVHDWTRRMVADGKSDVASEIGGGEKQSFAAPRERTAKVVASMAGRLVKRIVSRTRAWLSSEAIDAIRLGEVGAGAVNATIGAALEVLEDGAALRVDAGTMVSKAYNIGRAEAAAEVGATRAQYSAILDSNVCDRCRADDGKVYNLDSDEYDRAIPPNRDCEGGDNCRCIMVYLAE